MNNEVKEIKKLTLEEKETKNKLNPFKDTYGTFSYNPTLFTNTEYNICIAPTIASMYLHCAKALLKNRIVDEIQFPLFGHIRRYREAKKVENAYRMRISNLNKIRKKNANSK